MELSDAQLDSLAEALVEADDRLLTELIAFRKRKNISQQELAERMGVSQPTVAAFERYDSNPRQSSIRRYALAIGAGVEHTVSDQTQSREEAQVAFHRIVEASVMVGTSADEILRPQTVGPMSQSFTPFVARLVDA